MPRRLRIAAATLVCLYAGLIGVAWIERGQPWFIDDEGRRILHDYLAFRLAGTMAVEGRPADAYHLPTLQAELAAMGGVSDRPRLTWPYPPPLTLLLLPFALLPYALSWLVWILATGGCLVAAMRASPLLREGVWIVLASPASFAVLVKGQASFLTAALFTGFLVAMDRRPWVAGACLGLMTYKPHLGILIPIFLLVMRRWDIILAATLTALATVVISVLVLGSGTWVAFRASASSVTAQLMAPDTALPAMQTVYAGVALVWGEGPAMLVHGATALAALLMALRIVRSSADAGATSAAIIAASLLAAPYGYQHDLVLLAVACVFMLARPATRRSTGEVPLLVAALLFPAVTLFTAATWPGPLAAIIVLALAARRSAITAVPEGEFPAGTRPGETA